MNGTCQDAPAWPPFCGAVYPMEKVSGDPVVCTKEPHDAALEKHANKELGFEWWE